MTDKFQDKYRIPSARLQNWDYGSNAIYFVTICTQGRELYFGEISNQKIGLSEIGEIAHRFWNEIPNHFPFVELGEFVVMPNHVHGIIIIDKPNGGNGNAIPNATLETRKTVETQNFASLQSPPPSQQHHHANTFGPQSQNLASIIRGYKAGVKKYATLNRIDFAWQSRFHDHIIRNNDSFQRISDYILNNPLNWTEDKFFMP